MGVQVFIEETGISQGAGMGVLVWGRLVFKQIVEHGFRS